MVLGGSVLQNGSVLPSQAVPGPRTGHQFAKDWFHDSAQEGLLGCKACLVSSFTFLGWGNRKQHRTIIASRPAEARGLVECLDVLGKKVTVISQCKESYFGICFFCLQSC